jgi:nitrogen regulatory protein P-II 1
LPLRRRKESPVRLINAIIRPDLLDTVHRALAAFGAPGLTATGLLDTSRWNRHLEVYRAAVLVADTVPRVRVEVLVAEDDCADLANLLIRLCTTGHGGDDTFVIWTCRVEHAIRVRTGERGTPAT